eukprot:9226804-Karenia_brevis.AAC.1
MKKAALELQVIHLGPVSLEVRQWVLGLAVCVISFMGLGAPQDCRSIQFANIQKEHLARLVFHLSGGMQILLKTFADKTITLA